MLIGLAIGGLVQVVVWDARWKRSVVAHGCAEFVVGERDATEFRWKAK